MTALAASKESLPQPDGLRMKHNRTPSRLGEGTVQCPISSVDRALRYGRRGQGFEYLMGYVEIAQEVVPKPTARAQQGREQ